MRTAPRQPADEHDVVRCVRVWQVLEDARIESDPKVLACNAVCSKPLDEVREGGQQEVVRLRAVSSTEQDSRSARRAVVLRAEAAQSPGPQRVEILHIDDVWPELLRLLQQRRQVFRVSDARLRVTPCSSAQARCR